MAYIKFSAELDKQEIYANGIELATLLGQDRDNDGNKFINWPDEKKELIHTYKNPILITDLARLCTLDSQTRENVGALIQSPNRTVEYNNVVQGFNANDFKGVWGPSIDTLFLCHYLTNITPPKKIFEAGCGSGFIGKYLLEQFPEMQKATLTDISENAIACTNYCLQDERLKTIQGDANQILNNSNEQFDLIVTNPPYVPRPNAISGSPYEGLDMLAGLIKISQDKLQPQGKLISIISHLSETIIEQALKEERINAKYVAEKLVPFNVKPINNNKEWIEYLKKEHNIIQKPQSGHNYWHKIKILEITKT